MEDFAPVPTEAATQAVPTQEVCMPTQDILAGPRPRTLEEWVDVGQQVKRRRKSAFKAPVQEPSKRTKPSPSSRTPVREGAASKRKTGLSSARLAEADDVAVATQKVTEDVCPPTQKLAEEIPTQRLPEEPVPVETLDVGPVPEKAYRRSSRRRRHEAQGGAPPAPVAGPTPVKAVAADVRPAAELIRSRTERLSFQDMVSLGRRLRGKQTAEEAETPSEGEKVDESEDPAQGNLKPGPPQHAEVQEEPRAIGDAQVPMEMIQDEAKQTSAQVGLKVTKVPTPLRCPLPPADNKASTPHPANSEPMDCAQERGPVQCSDGSRVDLRGLVQRHIAEVQEALLKEQTPYQKVLEVYKALESSL